MATPVTPKVLPTHSQLAQLDRDLGFHPCTVKDPTVLTPAQQDHFNRDGYVKDIRIFSSSEITATRTFFDGALARAIARGGNSYSIDQAHKKYAVVWDLLTNPRIGAVVKDILGPDIVGWGSHFFCKMPGDGKVVAWHQDASYWPLTPSKTVTVWLAIDDADIQNGCMKFVAGSHHKGHLTFRKSDSTEHNVLNQTVENAEQYGEVVYNELQADEVSIHSDLLLHASDANTSTRRRCGLTLRYCTPDVRGMMGWNKGGLLLSGTDPEGHWGNPERPPEDFEGY